MIDMDNVKKLCGDSKTILMVTDKGMYVMGNKLEISTLFNMLCENLIKNSFSKEELQTLIDLTVKAKEVDTEKLDKLLEKFKEFSDALKKIKEEK